MVLIFFHSLTFDFISVGVGWGGGGEGRGGEKLIIWKGISHGLSHRKNLATGPPMAANYLLNAICKS